MSDPAEPGVETAPRPARRPSVESAPGDARRFVGPALAAAGALLLAVLALNAVVDPFGRLGTALLPTLIPTDRPVKVALVSGNKPVTDRVPAFWSNRGVLPFSVSVPLVTLNAPWLTTCAVTVTGLPPAAVLITPSLALVSVPAGTESNALLPAVVCNVIVP